MSDDFTNAPTYGWANVTCKVKHYCVACNRHVYVGVVNIIFIDEFRNPREFSPDFKILCRGCYNALDAIPETPGVTEGVA